VTQAPTVCHEANHKRAAKSSSVSHAHASYKAPGPKGEGEQGGRLTKEDSVFIAFEVSLEVIKSLRSIVPVIEANDRDLADQIRRAASCVALNLGEGQRSEKGNKRKHYAIAHGSANEVRAALLTAVAWGWLTDPSEALALLDRLLALLWRLTHPRT